MIKWTQSLPYTSHLTALLQWDNKYGIIQVEDSKLLFMCVLGISHKALKVFAPPGPCSASTEHSWPITPFPTWHGISSSSFQPSNPLVKTKPQGASVAKQQQHPHNLLFVGSDWSQGTQLCMNSIRRFSLLCQANCKYSHKTRNEN